MKPINLKIKGINSYVTEQEVDFEKLAQSNLFGVFGETGSGKTTILDAIVIALYGSSDRETIPNIINVNCKDAHIYFSFECEEKGKIKTFLVKRDYKVRQSGVKSDAILLDAKTNRVLAEQTDAVSEYILKLIGVGKKEFLKCIALPQGEFDRFLMDTPANRKKTIAKLFNLEDFGVSLQEKLKRRRDILTLKKLNIQEKIDMVGIVSEDSLELVRKNLKDSQKNLEKGESDLEKNKKLYETMLKDLEYTKELNSKETELVLMKSEQKQIAELKKQVEFTKKYGEYSIKLGKKNNLEQEISRITLELKDDKELLLNATGELERIDEELTQEGENLKQVKAELKTAEADTEKRLACVAKLQQLENQKKLKDNEVGDLTEDIRNLKETLVDFKKLIDNNEKEYKNLQNNIDDNKQVLDKLRDLKNVKTIEGILDYVHYAQTMISTDALEEVYQFEIHKEVKNLLDSLSNYEVKTRKQVIGLQEDYDTLARYNKDFEKLQSDLQDTNSKLSEQLADLKSQIDKVKLDKGICENQIAEKQFSLQDLKDEIRKIKSDMEELKEELKGYVDQKTCDKLHASDEKLTDLVSRLNLRKIELNDEKNKSVVSIEVSMTLLENYKKQLKEVEGEIKKLNLKVENDSQIDNTLYLDVEKLDDAVKNVEDYETKLEVLNSKIKELKSKLNGKTVSEENLLEQQQKISELEKQVKSQSINIALNKQTISQYEVALDKIEKLREEKQNIQKQLDTANELATLTANGKLLDYVSEEYMMLITQFSNKFVYRISKGKYMLKYSGEFFVVDNFNGGITRGVKTLSGGERFIISLSLALGISQSIAVNNNRKFNFFFIDEGFGSLSDNYIENVLNSFNALIMLGFTVGFISHVEKMQSFINNRIVVTKQNNEEGSVIKQYT